MLLGNTLISIFGKKNFKIEKVMTIFSISEKMFPKIESLMYALSLLVVSCKMFGVVFPCETLECLTTPELVRP